MPGLDGATKQEHQFKPQVDRYRPADRAHPTKSISKITVYRGLQLYRLLDRHERTHGKFYRQFARDVHRKLRRMKPARTCWRLDRQAAAIVKELGDKDSRRNDRFDIRDSRTYRRVERIYTSS